MPQIKPIVLDLQTDPVKQETYNPTSGGGDKAQFTNQGERFAENRQLKSEIRPAGPGNTGHGAKWLGVRPIPAEESANCCIDKDNIPANTFSINTFIHKASTPTQSAALVEMIRAFVLSDDFAATVQGSSFY